MEGVLDVVDGSQEEECGLKYVMFILEANLYLSFLAVG